MGMESVPAYLATSPTKGFPKKVVPFLGSPFKGLLLYLRVWKGYLFSEMPTSHQYVCSASQIAPR